MMRVGSFLVWLALSLELMACSGDDSAGGDATSGGNGSESRANGSGADGSVNDGSGADGAVNDGSGADGAVTDGSGADGAVNDGSGADGSGTGAGGSSSGSGGFTDEMFSEDCEAQSIGAEVSPPVIMLVVDTSQSMAGTRFASTNGLSKWEATRDALNQALRAMPADYAVGLVFYPNTPQNRPPPCFVENLAPIAPLTAQHITDLEAAMQNHQVAGYTPTLEAWKYAYAELRAWTPTDPIYITSDRYIIVITDGVPTRGDECEMPFGRLALARSQYMPLMDAAANGYANGVGTFVIGSPGSEDDTQGNQEYEDPAENYNAREMLSALAVAGGMAPADCANTGTPEYCHFDMTTSTDFTPDLVAALGSIAQSVVSCSYNIPEPSGVNVFLDPNPDTFTVEYYANGATTPENLIRAADDAACTEGWQLSADGVRIDLCSGTCERVKADPLAGIQVRFRCVVPQ